MKPFLKFIGFLLLLPQLLSAQAVPETFSHDVTYDGSTVTVNFTKFTNRGPLFEVAVQQADSSFTIHTPDEVRTYIGSVPTHPGAIAASIRRANGEILARVIFEDGAEWIDINGTTSQRKGSTSANLPTSVLNAETGHSLYAADIVLDLPFPQVTASGGTTATALEMAEYSMMSMNIVYMRDANIIHRIGRVIVRGNEEADPYKDMGTTNLLLSEVKTLFQEYMDGSVPTQDHDLGFVASTQVGGGLANVGVVGNGYSANGSSSNGDFSIVGRHELGHNWGSSHFEGGGTPEGNTIMSGNSLGKFSAGELQKIISHRISRSIAHLDDLGANLTPLPPRATDDLVRLEVGSPDINSLVLSNDTDANGGALSIDSITTSKFGVTPTNNIQSITISAPQEFSNQSDLFSYTISDPTGKTSTANVHISSFLQTSSDNQGHWTFEKSNTIALDSSSRAAHGTLIGDANIANCVLVLDGDGDSVTFTGPDIESNHITYSVLVYSDGTQDSTTGILFSRGGNGTFGLHVTSSNELRYHWDSSDWAYGSGLTIPENKWTFISLVVEPDQVTFYMQPEGEAMQTQVRTDTHTTKNHSQTYHIGRDTNSGREWNGMIDDARIFSRSLGASEITDLASKGLGARDPQPYNSEEISETSFRLSWQSSPLSTSDRLYFSSDYTTLRDATIGSSADLGIKSESFHSLTDLTLATYYWRIDSTETDGTIIKGNIWAFQIIPDGLIGHFPMDDSIDSTSTAEIISNRNGTIAGNPTLQEPGAAFHTGKCLCCNGVDAYTEVPFAAELNTDQFTFSLWARVDGSEDNFRSAITSRDDSPQKGFILYANPQNSWSYWTGNGSNSWTQRTDPENIITGQWYHIAGSYDGTSSTLYVDGQIVATGSSTYAANDNKPLRIGAGATEGDANYFFDGCLDDIRIWNRALSLDEIQSLAPYKNWINQNNLTGTSTVDLEASPGRNGNTNLINYAFFNDPDNPLNLLQILEAPNDSAYASFSLPYPLRNNLRYRIQKTNDLNTNWTTLATLEKNSESWSLQAGQITHGSSQANTTVLNSTPTDDQKHFWRFIVEE